ncbi:hypothetical protein HRbin28_02078 [bacterium HR28]|nr:hypothetical protein HRbin28_02078 [bacterium HR28]
MDCAVMPLAPVVAPWRGAEKRGGPTRELVGPQRLASLRAAPLIDGIQPVRLSHRARKSMRMPFL